MKILILENEQYLTESKDKPIIGRHYSLEDAESGTQAQNKAFHALITEYYKSGMHSYDKLDMVDFKKMIKKNLGAGFESFVYVEIKRKKNDPLVYPVLKDAERYLDIPEKIRKDPDFKQMIRGKLKSWSNYNKRERNRTMDKLITEMDAVGVCSKKYIQIREGMEEKNG